MLAKIRMHYTVYVLCISTAVYYNIVFEKLFIDFHISLMASILMCLCNRKGRSTFHFYITST